MESEATTMSMQVDDEADESNAARKRKRSRKSKVWREMTEGKNAKGKLAHRLKKEGAKILLAAGDTFRAAASDQLEIWAERTDCEIVVEEKEKAKASSGGKL
ncbi:cell division protein FtsY homolog, chloroplastic-like [Chenopodium quinoa]|uniref:cell division protein FtsY homolog, chloroplastic-like n=1 Tax=Chenopodium quinoa TaxID=63459 RepID=UPI000B797C35|nr:cell division protein FtsY homolog, chloroplastic-like [Chenopodium quinoa]